MFNIKIIDDMVYKSFDCDGDGEYALDDLNKVMKLKNPNIVNFTFLKDENFIKTLGLHHCKTIYIGKQIKEKHYSYGNYLIIMEKVDLELSKIYLSLDLGMSIIFQVLHTLYCLENINLTHIDLHLENIMLKKTTDEYLIYNIENKQYKIKTFGYIAKLIDIEDSISSSEKNNYAIKNFLTLCILTNEKSSKELLEWCIKNIFYNTNVDYIVKLYEYVFDNLDPDATYYECEQKFNNLKINIGLPELFNCFLI